MTGAPSTDTRSEAEALLREMQERADAERDSISKDAEQRAAEIGLRGERECELLARDAEAALEARLKGEREAALGAVRLELRNRMLELKRAAMAGVFETADARIREAASKPGYRDTLKRRLAEALEIVGDEALVEVAQSELELCRTIVSERKLRCTVGGADLPPGSLKARSADGGRRVDNSLAKRLERVRELHASEPAGLLFGAEDRPGGQG